MSSMHSWGLYNGRYGLSDLVLIDKIPAQDRPLAQRMLDGEIDRQKRLKMELAKDRDTAPWIEEQHLFQNYKQLQLCDTLALYFQRAHPRQRAQQEFQHVPLNAEQDVTITIRPRGDGAYEISPYPFAASGAEFAFAGHLIRAGQHNERGGWRELLRELPTRWENFRLVAG
jgi:Protein of unknown function (DUF3891)